VISATVVALVTGGTRGIGARRHRKPGRLGYRCGRPDTPPIMLQQNRSGPVRDGGRLRDPAPGGRGRPAVLPAPVDEVLDSHLGDSITSSTTPARSPSRATATSHLTMATPSGGQLFGCVLLIAGGHERHDRAPLRAHRSTSFRWSATMGSPVQIPYARSQIGTHRIDAIDPPRAVARKGITVNCVIRASFEPIIERHGTVDGP